MVGERHHPDIAGVFAVTAKTGSSLAGFGINGVLPGFRIRRRRF